MSSSTVFSNSIYILILESTVYVQLYSLFPQCAVFVLRLQFMSSEYSLCPYIIVYVLREQFMYVRVRFMSSRVQFMSSEYSLCPNSTVYVFREQFM